MHIPEALFSGMALLKLCRNSIPVATCIDHPTCMIYVIYFTARSKEDMETDMETDPNKGTIFHHIRS